MKLPKKQLAAMAAPALMKGAQTLYNNKDVLWNGAKMVYNAIPARKQKKNIGNGAMISHPQAISGAIAAPVSYAYPTKGRKPKFVSSKGSVKITHREYLRPVTAFTNGDYALNNTGGVADDFSINPLNPFLFPWLVGIAGNFDQYTFRSLRVEYKPLCGTSSKGRVGIFFDKDSSDPGPDDRSALANYPTLSEISVWAVSSLNIPVDNVKRFMADNPTSDPKLINLGKIGWATYGSDTVDVGELFVEYTVELFNAQPSTPTIESLFRNAGTGLETKVGLPYFTVEVASGTTLTYQARVPGTYIIVIMFNTTAGGFTPSITGGGVINSSFGLATGSSSAFVANITITKSANITLSSLTGATNAQIIAMRATKANVVAIS